MSFVHGKDAAVLLDGVLISAYFDSGEFSAEVDTAETTTFSSSWKSFIAGQAAGTVGLTGYFDPTWNDLWDTIGDAPGAVLTFAPGGLALGSPVRLVKVLTSAYGESAPIGGAVTFSWDVTADGSVGTGQVIAAATAITADTNGAAFDGGAATSNGAVAHLHVTSVSASDSIVVTIEDSANGSSGWATIGTFASKSAPGAERIAIAGNVRRYVRAVYDVTGSSVSIECIVTLSRL